LSGEQASATILKMLVDDFLPVYDVSDAVATLVEADVATTWDALMDIDLIEVGRRRPLVAALGALRALPEIVTHLVHGEAPSPPPRRLRLRDTPLLPHDQGGWAGGNGTRRPGLMNRVTGDARRGLVVTAIARSHARIG
jgi:hypothetical protein